MPRGWKAKAITRPAKKKVGSKPKKVKGNVAMKAQSKMGMR